MTKGVFLLAGTALAAIATPVFAQEQSAKPDGDIIVTGRYVEDESSSATRTGSRFY